MNKILGACESSLAATTFNKNREKETVAESEKGDENFMGWKREKE